MITMLRRLFWLALLGGAGYVAWTAWQQRQDESPAAAPEWPPIDPPDSAPARFAAAPTDEPDEPAPSLVADEAEPVPAPSPIADEPDEPAPAATGDERRWVEPLSDGSCPDSYPIKANDNSGIFHVPGGRFYDRTGAEQCYARAEDAEADGYRAAKS